MKEAREGIKTAYSSEQYILMQAINAYLELNRSNNLANERLKEWSGIYLPDVDLGSMNALASVAVAVAERKTDVGDIEAIVGDRKKAEGISKSVGEGAGRYITDEEAAVLHSFADYSVRTQQLMAEIEAYIKAASTRLMPNLTYLTDEKIAAEMLSKAGSLEKLATLPASTVQLLGAEKALFKHLKYGSKPPKYGVLFKLPEITAAPKHVKGRMARAYATKITIALKADYFSKRFIAEQLKEQLQKSIVKMKERPHGKEQRQTQFGAKPGGALRQNNWKGGGRKWNRKPMRRTHFEGA